MHAVLHARHNSFRSKESTYRSARDRHLNLSTGGAHQLGELGAHASEQRKTVVLGQCIQEVLDGRAAGASVLLELGDDGRLVAGSQRRGLENSGQLGIPLDQAAQLAQRAGGRLEGRGLDGGRVLLIGVKMTQVLATSNTICSPPPSPSSACELDLDCGSIAFVHRVHFESGGFCS